MNIGLSTLLMAPLSDTELAYTAAPTRICGIIDSKPTLNTDDAKIYYDDLLKYNGQGVTDGAIDLTIAGEDLEKFAPYMGWKLTTKSIGTGETATTYKDVEIGASDISVPLGVGYVESVLVENATTGKLETKYKATFFKKVTFAPFVSEGNTKQDKTNPGNQAVKGTIYPIVSSGAIINQAVLVTKELAIEALKAYFVQAA